MPTDVSVGIAAHPVGQRSVHRLPIGVGLSLGACASVALWAFIGLGVRALMA